MWISPKQNEEKLAYFSFSSWDNARQTILFKRLFKKKNSNYLVAVVHFMAKVWSQAQKGTEGRAQAKEHLHWTTSLPFA